MHNWGVALEKGDTFFLIENIVETRQCILQK